MRISIETVPSVILITLISLAQTYLLMGHVEVGDGVHYYETFFSLRGLSLVDGYQRFQDGLGASEFVSYFIFYAASQLISYEAFLFASNLAFALVIYLLYRRYEKGFFLYLCTVPLNFYFLAACFGAQRLKLGLMLFFLAVYAVGRARSRTFVFLSLFAHFQVAILIVAERVRGVFSKAVRIPVMEISMFLVICFALFLYIPVLQLKVLSYVLERGDVSYLTFLLSFFIALYVSRFDGGVVVEFLFFLGLIFLIGETRVNILVFCVLWRIIFLGRPRPSGFAYPISLYLSLKGVVFMIDVFGGGSGFDGA